MAEILYLLASMTSSVLSLNYLPLGTTESPLKDICSSDVWLGTDGEHILQSAYHTDRGTHIFKGNVFMLQRLHEEREREKECFTLLS